MCASLASGGGGRSYSWNGDNQPTRITGADDVTETYTYDADGARATRTRAGVTTVYLGGLEERDLGGATRTFYTFNGEVIAQRTTQGSSDTLIYLHGDHLGSVATTNADGTVRSQQDYYPWQRPHGHAAGLHGAAQGWHEPAVLPRAVLRPGAGTLRVGRQHRAGDGGGQWRRLVVRAHG